MNPSASTQNILTLVGRALIALLFIPAGLSKIGAFAGVAGYIASKGVPLPQVAAVVGIVAEVGLGALILIGWQTRWAALGMAIFTVVITFIFHNFWALPAEQVMAQQQAFFKNIAVVGGLLALVAWGAGGYSVDARRSV
ncbi:MAG: DoxX family protein [Ramlibacter sp.]|jgi:putative oxidoreductase|nr:DoxX family protein [Ramlibacter sp.]